MDIEKIIREYVDKTIHLSLGTSRANKPWVCEVHFVYDEDLNLYFRSLKSRRHSQEIALNPNVAGNIVAQHGLKDYPHAIYFEGTATIIEDEAERTEAYAYFKSRFGIPEHILEEAKSEDGHQFYKISVENWYAFGKFGKDSGEKYSLPWKSSVK